MKRPTRRSTETLTLAEFAEQLQAREPVLVKFDAAQIVRELREERAEHLLSLVSESLRKKKARPR
jgi:hypothetical protein